MFLFFYRVPSTIIDSHHISIHYTAAASYYYSYYIFWCAHSLLLNRSFYDNQPRVNDTIFFQAYLCTNLKFLGMPINNFRSWGQKLWYLWLPHPPSPRSYSTLGITISRELTIASSALISFGWACKTTSQHFIRYISYRKYTYPFFIFGQMSTHSFQEQWTWE